MIHTMFACRSIFTLIFAVTAVNLAHADTCEEINDKSKREQIIIPSDQSGRIIIGDGRAHFYTAPSEACITKNLFLIPGNTVNAYVEYQDYIYVMYFNPTTGQETSGWLKSGRVKFSGTGVGPARK